MNMEAILESYAQASGVYVKLVDSAGGSVPCPFDGGQEPQFCRLIRASAAGARNCRRSNVYGGSQARQLKEAYMYFCPYALINWAVAVENEGKSVHYVIAGPVLLHSVDELLLEEISRQDVNLSREQLVASLADIPTVSPKRLRHLALLLQYLVHGRAGGVETAAGTPLGSRDYAGVAEVIHRLKEEMDADPHWRVLYEQERQLVHQIQSNDQAGARQTLNEILGSLFFQDPALETIKARTIEVMGVLARAAIDAGADLEVVFGLQYRCVEEASKASDIHQLSQVVIGVLDRFVESIFVWRPMKHKDLIFRAMGYIRDHYHEPLGLDAVSEQVGLSAAYFSRLFKEQAGIGFSDYLTRFRIEKAKELLQQGRSLAEISQTVGFNDQSYFSRVFKRHEGVSPKKWLLR